MGGTELREQQYKTSEKFNHRILIHSRYGVNKTPWPLWLFSQCSFPLKARVIEFGCGTGLLWKVNSFRVGKDWQIHLTDFSPGMLESARSALGEALPQISYGIADLSALEPDGSRYTNILANHMLYHVKNRPHALACIAALLEPEGEFCCSTTGEGNMAQMMDLVRDFTGNDAYRDVMGDIASSFSLDNGRSQLEPWFGRIEVREYPDALEITDTRDLVNYVLSCNDLVPGKQVLPPDQEADFKSCLDKILAKKGSIRIEKRSGTFIARK